jgi:ABC-type branched-subunit amino acid transport system permease subunit
VLALATPLVWLFLRTESEAVLGGLLLAAAVGAVAARRLGLLGGAGANERALAVAVTIGLAAVVLALHDDHFSLLLLARVLLTVMACLGLHVQFGQAGVANFAAAAFFGVGGYTAAVLATRGVPHLLVLLAAGVMAALIGSVLLLPLLRTRGHYAALITIAFGLLFRTFVEVNDTLGGPQGLKLPPLEIFGLRFDTFSIGDFEVSLYVLYAAAAFVALAAAWTVVRRLETSWVGLALDAVRLDETAAACFGIGIPRWKIAAFTLGNFITGVAGALSAIMVGFIAPNNFTFRESLVFVSVILLGGLGNVWGLAVASFIVVALPEKLHAIQEYRFLLFSALVILVLVFRPGGLVPPSVRRHFGGRP